MDKTTTIDQIKNWCKEVRDERGWHPNARSLAISLSLEAGEILEHFQWDTSEMVEKKLKKDKNKKEEMEMEIGDAIYYLCEFADRLDIDISSSLKKTLKKIEIKYPVEGLKKYGDKFYYDQKRKYRQKK